MQYVGDSGLDVYTPPAQQNIGLGGAAAPNPFAGAKIGGGIGAIGVSGGVGGAASVGSQYSGPGTATGPAAPGPAPQAPGSVTLPGWTPDYAGLIQSDPAYGAAKAATDLSQGNAAALRKQRLQQAIIQYGGLPDGFVDQYGDVTPDVLDQAKNNQFSMLASLADNYSKSLEGFKRGLASRGALQSGELGYGFDQLDRAYGQQRYDAANRVGGDVNNALGDYTGVLGQGAQNLAGAVGQAEANVYGNPSYRPTPTVTATYDAKNAAAYGQPIYVDPSGNMYDVNGNPFSPPAAQANPFAGATISGAAGAGFGFGG